MDHWLSRFQDYQQLWQHKGLMVMIQNLLAKENVLSNLCKDNLAERSITNLKHCIELVQQAALDDHLGINKTLDYLHKNITGAALSLVSADEQQLRLESDEDAIKIITLHSSKGMEYPIVFCPYLWQRSGRLKKEKLLIKCHKNAKMIADLGSEQFEHHRQLALDEELAEELRIFYVAVTRAKYRCYINWADVRTKANANESAMAYLLGFSAADFSQQQKKLQTFSKNQPSIFEYRLLKTEQEISNTGQSQLSDQKFSWFCKQRHRMLYSHWQMSSYTALSSLTVHDAPEIPDDKAREALSVKSLDQNSTELPRGAHTGNVIHDLLENILFKILAEKNDISEQRDKTCLRYGLKTEAPEQIDLLLKNTVNTLFSSEGGSFSLKQLSEQQCLKEMPFYLSMKKINVSQINQLLKDCPTYQPLSEKTMCGYLTGFIDLICQHQGKYYVMDYKSNRLESYQQDSLIKAMREHNYGLQYWIYTLVLHLYLKKRMPGYSYEQHMGGVKYLFVRGMNETCENSGVYQTRLKLTTIEQLAELFI
jgi:exodeoxyribonuclease V beta subunit